MQNYDNYYPAPSEYKIDSGKIIFQMQLDDIEGKDVIFNEDVETRRVLIQRHTNPLIINKKDYEISVKSGESLNQGDNIKYKTEDYLVVTIPEDNDIHISADMDYCNNTLKWIDENDNIQDFPCVVKIISQSNSGIKESDKLSIIDKDIMLTVQQNQYTRNLKSGQRLIFKGKAFRCGEIITYINDGILQIALETDEISANDNLELGIADYYNRTTYTIEIPQGDIQLVNGNSLQLSAIVKNSLGQVMSKNVTWSSSDLTKATISNSGLITSVSDGNSIITAKLTDNELVTTNINLVVTSVVSDNYEIVLTPNVSSIRLTEKIDFNVRLMNNGVLLSDTFTISILGTTTALSSDYKFNIVDGNNFNLENLNDGKNVDIRIVSGIHTLDKTIELAWLY